MKKIILCLLLSSSLSYAANIEINISNINPLKGELNIALDTEKTYDNDDKSNSYFTVVKKAIANIQKVVITDVTPGIYAISIMHDENNNQKIDTNFFGIPYEGYGFSKNVIGYFGKPTFKETSFTVSDKNKIFEIDLVR
jgi:uncharacterized protein (DUF2141 family)